MQVTMTIPAPLTLLRHWKWLLLAFLTLALLPMRPAPVVATGNSFTAPDFLQNVGQSTSLALDGYGNPVVSYYDVTNSSLKVLHCTTPDCSISYGTVGGNIIHAPDLDATIGVFGTSLQLDAGGHPVISYFHGDDFDLKVIHCNDPNCIGADDVIVAPDPDGGGYSSLVLDSLGRPVVSHSSLGLEILYCGNQFCTAANSLTAPAGVGGFNSSLALDAFGYPVVSYRYGPSGDLNILHCNDGNCAGGDESITSPDTTDNVGEYTSLALDASGYPVVSYYDTTNTDLKVMHCNDANCDSAINGAESIVAVDYGGPDLGAYSSLELDALGYPVVSYYDATNGDLRVLHCGNMNCTSGNVVNIPDSSGDVGSHTSLELDSLGNPVVSYYDASNGDLKVLHCIDPVCSGIKQPSQLEITNLGQYALPKSCFVVSDSKQLPLFRVCDNDFAGAADSNFACVPDGICEDEDQASGSIKVTLASGDFRVEESLTAPEHSIITGKQACDTTAGDCPLTFLNLPNTRPWHPWDLVAQDSVGPPDGIVRVPDILAVVKHFFQDKPLVTPTYTPTATPTPCEVCG